MELARCDKYYDKVLEQFPEVSRKQLDRLVKRGLSSLYLFNLYGGDVLLTNRDYTMYFGKLFNSNTIFGKYAKIKWKIKLRIKYRQHKTKYSGYYYFGLSDEYFEKYYLNRTNRKSINFPELFMCKILEECFLDHGYNHFFRIKYPEDCGFVMFKKDYLAKNIEYIYKRNSDKSIEPVSYETKRNKCVKRRVK